MSIKCELVQYYELKKKFTQLGKVPQKTIQQVNAEAKKRVPTWVAAEVTKVYGIKKSELTGGDVGKVRVQGSVADALKVVYTGRVLTPTHFGMKPEAPKIGGGYTLRYRVLNKTQSKVKKLTKKQRKDLAKNFSRQGPHTSDHSPIMLMRANGGHFLPFQRKSTDRKNIEAIKTVSLPQMVSSERTLPQIQEAINEGLGKRLEHYLNRNMPK